MSKELEALQKLRGLVEYLTRVDFVPTELRNEVKELLINSYQESNGYFSQIEQALKRNEPMKVDLTTEHIWFYKCPNCGVGYNIMEGSSYCPDCGQKLDWSDEK